MDMRKTKLALTLRDINRLIATGNAITHQAEADVATVKADGDRSETYKARTITEIERGYHNQLRELSAMIEDDYSRLGAILDEAQNDFDYRDAELMAAVQSVKTLGGSMPYGMREQVAERFRGRPEMLKALKGVFKDVGFSTVKIDEMIAPFETLSMIELEPLREMIVYADARGSTPAWHGYGEVKALVTKLAEAFGCDLAINPYLSEIRDLREHTADDSKKARDIDRWLGLHADALQEDAGPACELAGIMLNEWAEAAD